MIFRRELLDQLPSQIRKSIQFLESQFQFDIHLIAISEEHLLNYQSFEKRHKAKICRTGWKNAIAQNKGVIFIISSGMFFRKKNSEIESSIQYLKEFIQVNSFQLTFDQIEKSEKFDVYFLAIKEELKNSENAN
jgi:hypothetical protein